MKQLIIICTFFILAIATNAQDYKYPMPEYVPTAENMESRKEFQEMRFGMFIHWGIYSVLGDGEWVMFQQHIPLNTYRRLASFFNPQEFNQKNSSRFYLGVKGGKV
jgi:alpha-L-fucosidase